MREEMEKRLRRATVVYWVLLLYIIAALVWWFLSLEQQNTAMYELKKTEIGMQHLAPAARSAELSRIEDQKKRNTIKHISEGVVFLLLIIIGAAFIYRSVRNQFRQQLYQQNFLMAISHELKTPVAVSRLNLETIQKHQLDEARRERLLQMTLQETIRLDTLINNLLISSQLEGNSYQVEREELDFSSLASDTVQEFTSRYPDRPLTADIREDLELTGDAILLKLLISNLLENANKYAPKGTRIHFSLFPSDAGTVLQVADEGPGIAEEERKLIFRKFYRIGNEQVRKTKGTGLGLFLCKKIAEDHKGEIRVGDNKPQGSIFTVTFYA